MAGRLASVGRALKSRLVRLLCSIDASLRLHRSLTGGAHRRAAKQTLVEVGFCSNQSIGPCQATVSAAPTWDTRATSRPTRSARQHLPVWLALACAQQVKGRCAPKPKVSGVPASRGGVWPSECSILRRCRSDRIFSGLSDARLYLLKCPKALHSMVAHLGIGFRSFQGHHVHGLATWYSSQPASTRVMAEGRLR